MKQPSMFPVANDERGMALGIAMFSLVWRFAIRRYTAVGN